MSTRAPASGPPLVIKYEEDEFGDEVTQPTFAGRYDVVRWVGAGGMGSVYLARDKELDEEVALKVLRPDLCTPDRLELFRREVRLARRVTHPNVARVHDIGEADGTWYFTMEYVTGVALGAFLRESGPLDVDRALSLGIEIARGLAAAHAVSVVHRDLKPDNVLLGPGGRVVITDFGIARVMGPSASATITAGLPVGTPAYMAPEQVEALPDVDARADIYSLGALLFEALTGRLPFLGESPFEMAAARLTTPPLDPRTLRPDIPEDVSELLLRMLARDREDRPATIGEVVEALTDIAGPTPSVVLGRERRAPARAAVRVAVLPFEARAGSPRTQVDGLWEDVVDALSSVRGVRVRPRSALASLRGAADGALVAGRALSVDVVVEGSVTAEQGIVRVSIRATSVRDGFQLFARRFEASIDRFFELTDRIAGELAHALGGQRIASAVGGQASPPEAIDLYLRAREVAREAVVADPSPVLDLLERAKAIAPEDPNVLAAYALASLRAYFLGVEGAAAYERARQNALAALAIAPHRVDARHVVALCHMHAGDEVTAVEIMRRLADRTDYPLVHESLGSTMLETGALDVARRHFDLVLESDPDAVLASFELCRLEAYAGRFDLAEGRLDALAGRAGERVKQQVLPIKLRLAIWRGDIERVVDMAQQSRGVGTMPAAVHDALVKRDFAGAMEVLRRTASVAHASRRIALLGQLEAELAVLVGDDGAALGAIDRAVTAGLFDIAWLSYAPCFDVVRSSASFLDRLDAVRARADRLRKAYEDAAIGSGAFRAGTAP